MIIGGTPLGYNGEFRNKILSGQISYTIRELKALFLTDNILVGGDFNCVPGMLVIITIKISLVFVLIIP